VVPSCRGAFPVVRAVLFRSAGSPASSSPVPCSKCLPRFVVSGSCQLQCSFSDIDHCRTAKYEQVGECLAQRRSRFPARHSRVSGRHDQRVEQEDRKRRN